jgi:hypothetical protein
MRRMVVVRRQYTMACGKFEFSKVEFGNSGTADTNSPRWRAPNRPRTTTVYGDTAYAHTSGLFAVRVIRRSRRFDAAGSVIAASHLHGFLGREEGKDHVP